MTRSVLLSLLLLLSACSGSSGAPSPAPGPANLEGTWRGSLELGGVERGQVVLVLFQRGRHTDGAFFVDDGSPCLVSSELWSGRGIVGRSWSAATSGPNGSVSLTGTIRGATIAGAYRVYGTACAGEAGELHLRRDQVPPLPAWRGELRSPQLEDPLELELVRMDEDPATGRVFAVVVLHDAQLSQRWGLTLGTVTPPDYYRLEASFANRRLTGRRDLLDLLLTRQPTGELVGAYSLAYAERSAPGHTGTVELSPRP